MIAVQYDLEYYTYLDELRRSGITNMYGAAEFMEDAFSELDHDEAKDILLDWMHTFGARREAGETGDKS